MNVEDIYAKCDHLSAVGLLPREQDLPYRGWLQNFDEAQRTIAAEILNRLIFVTETMAQAAVSCAYQRLLRAYTPLQPPDDSVPVERLRALHESIIVAPIQGEHPSATDSAFAYMRAARDQLGFKESQIMTDPLEAARLAADADRPIVLFDDISGSGDQIEATLTRRFGVGPSLASLANRPRKVACLTAVMTSAASQVLAERFPHIGTFAGHVLELNTYGVHGTFPPAQHPEIQKLLRWAAQKTRVPPHVDELYGYGKMGLMLCFYNSIPDSSLPILWANGGDSWTPLKVRPDG